MNEDKSTRFQRLKRTVTWIWLAAGAVALLVLLPGGGAIRLRQAIVDVVGTPSTSLVTAMLFAATLVVVIEIARLPVTVYKKVLERRYGLPRLPLGREIVEDIKGLPLGVTLVAVHAAVVYACLARWPTWWWLIAAAFFAAVIALLTVVAPVVTPVFYSCTPLARPELRSRLASLATRAGVDGLDVYEWASDAGRRRVNAALVGVGRGRRVLLSDTLLTDYTHDEIEVIVAHELGHHVHRDIASATALRALLLVVGFGAAAALLNRFWQPLGFDAPHDAATMPLLALAGGLVALLPRPLLNAVSRRKEFRADRFALTLTGRPDAFVSAMRRAAAQKLAEVRPSTATVWLFHSHPSVEQRIKAARTFQP